MNERCLRSMGFGISGVGLEGTFSIGVGGREFNWGWFGIDMDMDRMVVYGFGKFGGLWGTLEIGNLGNVMMELG